MLSHGGSVISNFLANYCCHVTCKLVGNFEKPF